MPDPIISIPWTDDSPVLDFNGLRARVASLEETARLNAEEYIKAQAETTRWAARCGVEKGLREQAEARVAELEGLHRTYYNQPFAEACQRAAREERERCIAEAFGWWAGTENLETLTTDEAAEGIRAALQPKSECLIQ